MVKARFRKLNSGAIRAEVFCKGKRSPKTLPTKQAAKEWAARQECSIAESTATPVDHGTFGDIPKRYANEVSPSRRGERWEILKIRNFRSDPVSANHMADLTPEIFARWRDKRLCEVQPATVSREMQLMSAILNSARKEWGMFSDNPLSDLRKPKKPRPRNRLPSADEPERLAYAAGGGLSTATSRAFHAFRFAIQTAMRAGGIVGLTWDRGDLQRRVARLDQTKNGRSRELPLSSEAVRLPEALPKSDPVFNLTRAQVGALWRKMRDKAQAVGLNFHASRTLLHLSVRRIHVMKPECQHCCMRQPRPLRYSTTNWPACNAALRRCGSLSIWVDPTMAWHASKTGKRGHPETFSESAIQTCLTLKFLFGPPLRQTVGLVASLIEMAGLPVCRRPQRHPAWDAAPGTGQLEAFSRLPRPKSGRSTHELPQGPRRAHRLTRPRSADRRNPKQKSRSASPS